MSHTRLLMRMIPLIPLFAGCVEDAPLPDVGPCAVYPDGVYEYGQIGIGTCLAGPTDLAFLPDGHHLAISNANPWVDFTGGSFLVLDLDLLDPEAGRTLVTDMDPHAVPLPSFSGAMAVVPNQQLALVTNRLSAEARTRQNYDDVYLIDITDPSAPILSDRGEDGGATMTVGADPNAVTTNLVGQMAWVVNRTQHSVSILDMSGDTVKIVPPGGPASVSGGSFVDADASGSHAEFDRLQVVDADKPSPHDWSLSWRVGSVRAWFPTAGGAQRLNNNGESLWQSANVVDELDISVTNDEILNVNEPSFTLDNSAIGHIFFEDQGLIRQAVSTTALADWDFLADVVLSPGSWDSVINSPNAVLKDGVWYLFYAGGDGSNSAIGLANSSDGVNFDAGTKVFSQEGQVIGDPYVFYDEQIQRWRMFYTADAGSGRFIGQAESDDLLNWTARSEVFTGSGDASRPSVGYYNGLFHLFYTSPIASEWEVREAISTDGYAWIDAGRSFGLSHESGVAMQFSPEGVFHIENEAGDVVSESLYPGASLASVTDGWSVQLSTGFSLGTEEGGDLTAEGVQLDATVGNFQYFTVKDFSGTSRIALGESVGTEMAVPNQVVINPGEGFRADAVYNASVVAVDNGYVMLFAGRANGVSRIGRATSSDGLVWTVDNDPVLQSVGTWDSVEMAPGSLNRLDDGSLRLWFTAYDGQSYRVGLAESADDGKTWTRLAGPTYEWVLDGGAPGDWYDSGVRDPYVVMDGDIQRMWFAGYSGDLWQIGYAERNSDADEWRIPTDALGSPRPVLAAGVGSFGAGGLVRPVVTASDTGWDMGLTGVDAGITRVGEASGPEADRMHRILNQPTLGDSLSFHSEPERNEASIPLDIMVAAGELQALGCSDATLDEPRGFLYVSCRLVPEVIVIDVRDDSSGSFVDTNYLDIEAIVVVETGTTSGGSGWRGAMIDTERGWLWGLGDAPEALQAIDLSDIEDNAGFELIRHPFTAMLPLPRAGDRDKGMNTQAWVGPSGVAQHPDGKHLMVANFNANSVSIYDMSLGVSGILVAEATDLCENPYAIEVSPDGLRTVVACYSGEIENAATHSSLVVLDTDPLSPTFSQPLGWVVNQ